MLLLENPNIIIIIFHSSFACINFLSHAQLKLATSISTPKMEGSNSRKGSSVLATPSVTPSVTPSAKIKGNQHEPLRMIYYLHLKFLEVVLLSPQTYLYEREYIDRAHPTYNPCLPVVLSANEVFPRSIILGILPTDMSSKHIWSLIIAYISHE